ncbi:hypothetical protein DVK07_21035, partial [Halorubrum sp. Atlit-26R]
KDRRRNGGEEMSVVQFSLEDLSERPGVLELLTKESIRSGKSAEIAEQVAETNRTIRYLSENESTVTDSVASAVTDEVGELPIDLQAQSREFVQGLVSLLREQRQFVGETENELAADSPSTTDDGIDVSAETGSADGPDNRHLEPVTNQIAGTIRRRDLEGDPDSTVAVFPTRESGL